jgi:acyl-CoA thioester hydrolase
MSRTDFKFSYGLRVRYAETDAQGIVFNAHYLTYFDTAIYEYFRSLPFDYLAHAKDRGEDFHTVKVGVEFHRPCHFDDEIDVCVRIPGIGRSSLTFQIEIFSKDGEDLRASGQVIWVNVDQKSGASAGLPSELVDLIKQSLKKTAKANPAR